MFDFLKSKMARMEAALDSYSVYSPPIRVEERLLGRGDASQNFEYFLETKADRIENLRGWLHKFFRVKICVEIDDVGKLEKWYSEYSGFFIREIAPDDYCYFDYHSPWIEKYKGLNVVFDIGSLIGEMLIARCPMLKWDLDPVSSVLPKIAKAMRRDEGSGFQRPMISGGNNPTWHTSPIDRSYDYASRLYFNSKKNPPKWIIKTNKQAITNYCKIIVEQYPDFGIRNYLARMSLSEYISLVNDTEN